MNPYLEHADAWHDFHQRFPTAFAHVLAPQLGDRYIAKIDTEVYIQDVGGEDRLMMGRPDVHVDLLASSEVRKAETAAARQRTAAPAYSIVPTTIDEVRVPFLKIEDTKERRVVTVVELLSPSNKLDKENRAVYLAKRRRLFRSQAHFIEIDLLRAGERMPMVDLPQSDYCILISRADERPEVATWPLKLRDPLPTIPVPLLAPDPDAKVDLKEVLDSIYDDARYALYIYDSDPHPPLHPTDVAWAKQFKPQIARQ
jgi:hypothetical protein